MRLPVSSAARSEPLRLIHPPAPAAPADGPKARTGGVVLIGTLPALSGLLAQSAGIDPAAAPVGAVLIDPPANGSPRPVAVRDADGATEPVRILGSLDDLPALHSQWRFSGAVVCIPGAMRGAAVRVGARLRELGITQRLVPTLADALSDAAADNGAPPQLCSAAGWRPAPAIDLGELIGRTPHDLDRRGVARVLRAKRVLITGAGGSIGSHLAKVAAAFRPEQLVLMERSENALFEIDRQIGRAFPDVPRRAVLHDVADHDGTIRHLISMRPQVVFHAAAHKHVPLMEDHPAHAVTNNFFGTRAIADAALACEAERFVMISTDKAVNPSSVMGATKRLAELYVRSLAGQGATRLGMVRFGNVLGSAASVLTIWSAQLSEGGPITVTDPRMTRFFMTIPEAATLVVQAAALDQPAGGAPVYVLDMGEPIRVLDLACRFVRAHGLWPVVRGDVAGVPPQELAPPGAPTIDVLFTGARPGEKLHEELAYAAEDLSPTAHPGIRCWAPASLPDDAAAPPARGRIAGMISDLSTARFAADRATILAAIHRHLLA